MIDRAELSASIWGAYRLARLDPQGMNWFNLTADGFFNSFFAALLVAPCYALQIAFDEMTGGRPHVLAADIVTFPLVWLVYPVLLGLASRPLGLAANYVPAVVAVNWAQTIIAAALLPVSLIAMSGVLGPFGAVLYLAAYGVSLFYTYFVLRTALQTTAGTAAALTILGELGGVVLQIAVANLFASAVGQAQLNAAIAAIADLVAA